jgi:hypothetical protein
MNCEKFVKNSCHKKVVVLAPGAADLSEGMACLHQGEDCTEGEQGPIFDFEFCVLGSKS